MTSHLARRSLVAALLCSALVLVELSTAGTPDAAAAPVIRATEDVNVRVAPNLSGGVIRRTLRNSSPSIRCAIAGQAIYENNVWFYSDFGGGVRGFWSAHYSSAEFSSWTDLQARYGIQRCERASTVGGGSVYYQPRYSEGDPIAPYSTYSATKDFWAAGGCSAAGSAYWPASFDGKYVTRASGWSVGRLGLTYLLAQYPERAGRLEQIVLFDPGSLSDYRSECDLRYDQDGLLAAWLAGGPNRRLLVIAGEVTRDQDHPDSVGRLHQGIQQYLFPAVRDRGLASRVLVCNYDKMKHVEVMSTFGYLAASGSVTSCPGRPNASWRP